MTHAFHGRREDRRLVTGQGKYTSDWNFDNQAHGHFLRADRGHAVDRRVPQQPDRRRADAAERDHRHH